MPMTKTIYTLALNFSVRQQKAVCTYNGFSFSRQADGSHEIWENTKGDIIVLTQHLKGTTFAAICRKHKFVFVDKKGKKVY